MLIHYRLVTCGVRVQYEILRNYPRKVNSFTLTCDGYFKEQNLCPDYCNVFPC
jgi:hypothetical protein